MVGGSGHGFIDEDTLPGGLDTWGPEEDGETGLPTPEFPLSAEETGFEDGVGVGDCCAGFGAGGLPESCFVQDRFADAVSFREEKR